MNQVIISCEHPRHACNLGTGTRLVHRFDELRLLKALFSRSARQEISTGTDNYERTKLASTWFHHTALGLASTTTDGVNTGFIREPTGTLNSTTTGGSPTTTSPLPHDGTGNVLGLVDDAGKRTHAYGPTGLPRGTTGGRRRGDGAVHRGG
ncbi:hypothetical protein ACFWWC_17165 [Streptomyces sp. NPDC058642]|uniref:hypothetical protein n=1 Tax=Streptomyces sp. NPDC058642 TaxID=3346572 RepID=UPI00364FD3F3